MFKEAGRVTYETPVTQAFPEFSGFAKGVTVRNLLHHTAGFPIYYELCNTGKPVFNADVVRFVTSRGKMDFAPGTGASVRSTGISSTPTPAPGWVSPT